MLLTKKFKPEYYTRAELKAAEKLWVDLYTIPYRVYTDNITIRLNEYVDPESDWNFEEKEVLEDALWIYIQYLKNMIKSGHGANQGRPYKDVLKECDEKEELVKKYR